MPTYLTQLLAKIGADTSSFEAGEKRTMQGVAAIKDAMLGMSGAAADAGEGFAVIGTSADAASAQAVTAIEDIKLTLASLGASAVAASGKVASVGAGVSTMAAGMVADLESVAHAAQSVGGIMVQLGVGIAAGLGAAAYAGAALESKLVTVRNNTTMTASDFAAMSEAVKTLSAQSGAPMDQLADGFMHISNFGYHGAAAVNILQAAMKSAIATGSNVSDTADILAKSLHEFGMSAGIAGRAMNVMHLAAADGNMTLQQFDQSAGTVFSVAASLHAGFTAVAAGMSVMTQHGYDAAEAATEVRDVLQHIIQPANDAKKAIKAISKSSGIDLVHDFTAAGLASKSFYGVMHDVADATRGHADEVLKLIPALRGGQGAMVLASIGANDLTNEFKKLNEAMAGQLDPTTEGYNRSLNTFAQQWARLVVTVQQAGAELGTVLLPILKQAVDGLQAAVQQFSALPQPIKEFIVVAAAAAAAVLVVGGALLSVAGSVMTFITGFSEAAAVVGGIVSMFDGVGEVILAVVAVVAVAVIAWKTNFLGFRDVVTETWRGVQEAFSAGTAWLRQAAMTVDLIMVDVVTYWRQVWADASAIIGVVWSVISAEIREGVQEVQALLVGLMTVGQAIWVAVVATVQAAVNSIGALLTALGNAFLSMPGPLGDAARAISTIFGGIVSTVQGDVATIGSAMATIGAPIADVGSYIKDQWNAAGAAIAAANGKVKVPAAPKLPGSVHGPILPDAAEPGAGAGKAGKGAKQLADTYKSAMDDIRKSIAEANAEAGRIGTTGARGAKEADTAYRIQAGDLKGISKAAAGAILAAAKLDDQTKVYLDTLKTQHEALENVRKSVNAGVDATALQQAIYEDTHRDLSDLNSTQQIRIRGIEQETLALMKQKSAAEALQKIKSAIATTQEPRDLKQFQDFIGLDNYRDNDTAVPDLTGQHGRKHSGERSPIVPTGGVAPMPVIVPPSIQTHIQPQMGSALSTIKNQAPSAASAVKMVTVEIDGMAVKMSEANAVAYNLWHNTMKPDEAIEAAKSALKKLGDESKNAGDELTQQSVSAVGGQDAWDMLAGKVDKSGKSMQQLVKDAVGSKMALDSLNSSVRDLSNQAWDAANPNASHRQKEDHSIDDTLGRSGMTRQQVMQSPTMSGLINQADTYEDSLDVNDAKKQLQAWQADIGTAAGEVKKQLAGIYDPAQAAVDEWMKSNREAILTFQAQMANDPNDPGGAKALGGLQQGIKDKYNSQQDLDGLQKARELVADTQKSMLQMSTTDPFKQYLVSLMELDKNGNLALPKGIQDNMQQIKAAFNFQQEQAHVKEVADGMSSTITDAFKNMYEKGPKNFFANVITGFDNMFEQIGLDYIQSNLQKLLGGLLQGVLGGSAPSVIGGGAGTASDASSGDSSWMNIISLFGQRAAGGIMAAGEWYLAGENGPELINMPRPGRASTAFDTANGSASRSRPLVVQVQVPTGMHAKSFQQSRGQIAKGLAGQIQKELGRG